MGVSSRKLLLVLAAAFLPLQGQADEECKRQQQALLDENAKLKAHVAQLQAANAAVDTTQEKQLGSLLATASVHVSSARSRDPLPAQASKTHVRSEHAAHVPGEALPIPATRESGLRAQGPTAVVVMACNRPDYLQRTLDSIFAVNPDVRAFPVFISQDGTHAGVKSLAQQYSDRLSYLQHIEAHPPVMKSPKENIVYYRIAEHYKWAFTQLFDERGFRRVIVLEDDMELSPDFFQFFDAMAPRLDVDPTLWCVSSWNDNGQTEFVHNASAVYRSDFFPGLGWMLAKHVWDELRPIWTTGPPSIPGVFGGYWDDWMRNNEVRKGRQCLRPEVCRTFNFGEHGASKGQFFKDYLVRIKLNDQMVDWAHQDLGYLDAQAYRAEWARLAASARDITSPSDAFRADAVGDLVLWYHSQRQFEQYAKILRIMAEWKAGVPRGSYQGVVSIRVNNGRGRLFVAPGPEINMHAEGYVVPVGGGRP